MTSINKTEISQPPLPKTEDECLRYRILELEAEEALLKKLREYNQEKIWTINHKKSKR